MKSISIEGEVRKSSGKKDTRELRKKGLIPCSIYGGEKNMSFIAPAPAFKSLLYTPEFYTAKLKLDGKEIEAVIQDIQFDPLTDEVIHIDFLELHEDKKVTLDLPIKLEGTPIGAREGGKINQRMKKIKVRLYPKDLVEHITVKIDQLELGKSVRIGDLTMDGIEFLNAPHIPIVSVIIPRQVKEEEAPATTAAATTPAAGAAAAGTTPAAEKGGEKKEEKEKEKKK